MSEMLENKIKVKKFDIISLLLILMFFGIDRISKISVIKRIQSEQGDIFLNDVQDYEFVLIWASIF